MNEFLQALITIGFLGTMMWAMLKFMLRDIHKDLFDIDKNINELKIQMHEIRNDMKEGRARTDNLYNICVEILKGKK